MAKKQRKCPKCHGKNVVPIVYGYPTVKACDEAEEGKLILGGCCLSEDSPEWFCSDCKYEFGRILDDYK